MALGGFKFRTVVVSLIFVVLPSAFGASLEGVDFADQFDLGAQKLVLNGVGLRSVRRMGLMHFKVYVAGLYVMSKNSNANEIINSSTPKVIKLIFLRDVDAASLRKGWNEGYQKVCKDQCESTKANLKMFSDFMVDVKEKTELRLRFDEDGVNIKFEGGAEPHSGHISSPEFRKNLLAVFIGDNPPTEQLKSGLLGLDKKNKN